MKRCQVRDVIFTNFIHDMCRWKLINVWNFQYHGLIILEGEIKETLQWPPMGNQLVVSTLMVTCMVLQCNWCPIYNILRSSKKVNICYIYNVYIKHKNMYLNFIIIEQHCVMFWWLIRCTVLRMQTYEVMHSWKKHFNNFQDLTVLISCTKSTINTHRVYI